MDGMRLWRKAVPLTPVSSNTRFLSAQAQSSVEWSARVHKATLLESAMSLTNGQLRKPRRLNVESGHMRSTLMEAKCVEVQCCCNTHKPKSHTIECMRNGQKKRCVLGHEWKHT